MRRLFAPFLWIFCLTLCITLWVHGCTASTSKSTSDVSDRLATEHRQDQPVATPIAAQAPKIPVVTESVTYATIADQPITGYLARPQSAEQPLPGIIAIHEWWGLNDNIESVSRRLAGEGYTVLAVDLYRGQTADTPDQARQLVSTVTQNPEAAQANLKQAYDYLTQEQNATAVGSIGWCFGGGWSLQTGLLLPQKLNAVVIYYGRLITDIATLKPLQMPILGIFGGKDQAIPVTQVREFEAALQQLGKTVDIQIYEEADHAFANPSGQRYEPKAAEDAWNKTITFFNQTLKSS